MDGKNVINGKEGITQSDRELFISPYENKNRLDNLNKSEIKEKINSVYSKYAKEYDEQIASLALYNDSYDYLLHTIRDNSTILDLACGPGNVSYYLKNNKPDIAITGIDISKEMIAIAKRRIPDGDFLVMDICDVNFKTKFDCVVCAFALPYLNSEETDQVARIIRDSVKSTGHFYVSFIEGVARGFEKTSFTGGDDLFFYHYPENVIVEKLARQSLSVIKKFEVDYQEMDGSITKEILYIGNKSIDSHTPT